MKRRPILPRIALIAGLAVAAAVPAAAQKLYRWVDHEGKVHYGDHVPPEFANQDRDLLNDQGVTVGFEAGGRSEDEQAEAARLAAEQAEAEQLREEQARRDRILLDTYLTVADIEDLRDRRLELIDSQIRVTEFYLENLKNRLAGLERESKRFAPHSDRENAPPMPESLALEISRTQASIELYEQTLVQSRAEKERLRTSFDLDIERFRELKGG